MQSLNTWGGFRPQSFTPKEKGLEIETEGREKGEGTVLPMLGGSGRTLQRAGCGYTAGPNGLLDGRDGPRALGHRDTVQEDLGLV